MKRFGSPEALEQRRWRAIAPLQQGYQPFPRKTGIRLAVLCCVVICLIGYCKDSSRDDIFHEELAPYVSFLKAKHLKPVDYIMGLFERYDIVILSERYHNEMTQWDFIYELTSDKRFMNEIGHVFTEYGTVSLQPVVDELLSAETLSEEEVENKVLQIIRNFPIVTHWTRPPFYEYLKKLYFLNKALPREKTVRLYLSDIPFSWEGMTKEKYRAVLKQEIALRDKIMAERIIKKFREIQLTSGQRKKCLVIMNFRHAFGNIQNARGEQADNCGGYIFEAFPRSTANVLINTVVDVLKDGGSQEYITAPTQNGKWDAAFQVLGNPELGFNFKESPFGQDKFDLFPYDDAIKNLRYRDVFTGFVFFKPLRDHLLSEYVPGLFDTEFLEEVNRRRKIFAEVYHREMAAYSFQYVTEYKEREGKDYKESLGYHDSQVIDQWLHINNR